MKLAEALAERVDAQRRITQLRERIPTAALVQEGVEPAESVDALLTDIDRTAARLGELIERINRTNLTATTGDGTTLTAALAQRDILRIRHRSLLMAADESVSKQARWMRTELRLVPTIDTAAIRRRADDLARELRLLDLRIQEAGWSVDLVE